MKEWIQRHRFVITTALLITVSIIAVFYLHRGFSFLLSGDRLAVDLALRYWEINRLLSGENIYVTLEHLPYPPGALFILYPLIGWVSYEHVSLLWAIWNAVALLSILYITWKFLHQHMDTGLLWLVIISIGAFQSIGQTLGVGQITVIYMGAFAWYLLIIYRNYFDSRIIKWILAPLLIAFFAGKFTIFLPVCVYLLWKSEHRWGIVIGGILHALGFYVAAKLTGTSTISLIVNWLDVGEAYETLGSIDLSAFLYLFKIGSPWSVIVAVLLMCVLTFYLHRNSYGLLPSMAILMIFARFWMYHNHYDNLMLWPVYLVLILVVAQSEFRTSYKEWGILILFTISLILPARVLYWDAPFYGIFLMYQVIVWGYVVYYLVAGKNYLTSITKSNT